MMLYSVRRLNRLPPKFDRAMYTFLLSPMLLTSAMCWSDRIAIRYRQFLVKFTYPSCLITPDTVYTSCRTVHGEMTCVGAFLSEGPWSILRVIAMYLRFYLVRTIIALVIMRRRKIRLVDKYKHIFYHILSSTLWSSLFLGGQCTIQRMVLCAANKRGMEYGGPCVMYLLSVISSTMIVFERAHRVKSINNIVICQLLLGWMRRNHVDYSYVAIPLFLKTLSQDHGIHFCNLGVSALSAAMF